MGVAGLFREVVTSVGFGTRKPSRANQAVFDRAVQEITRATTRLLDELVTNAPPRNREVELQKARERFARRAAQ